MEGAGKGAKLEKQSVWELGSGAGRGQKAEGIWRGKL